MSFVGEVAGPAEAPAASRTPTHDGAPTAKRRRRRGGSSVASCPCADRERSRPSTRSFPWFGMNALIHYLTPYGLEQFSGAAWGTRDVCQGPIDLLLCQEKYAAGQAGAEDPVLPPGPGRRLAAVVDVRQLRIRTRRQSARRRDLLVHPRPLQLPQGQRRLCLPRRTAALLLSEDGADPAAAASTPCLRARRPHHPARSPLVRARHGVGPVRRRRLERLAAASQRGAGAAPDLELDGADVLPGLRRVSRGVRARRQAPRRRAS